MAFSESYGSVWMRDVVNQSLGFSVAMKRPHYRPQSYRHNVQSLPRTYIEKKKNLAHSAQLAVQLI